MMSRKKQATLLLTTLEIILKNLRVRIMNGGDSHQKEAIRVSG